MAYVFNCRIDIIPNRSRLSPRLQLGDGDDKTLAASCTHENAWTKMSGTYIMSHKHLKAWVRELCGTWAQLAIIAPHRTRHCVLTAEIPHSRHHHHEPSLKFEGS